MKYTPQEVNNDLPVWLYWEGERPAWINACHDTVIAHAGNVQLVTPESFDKLRDGDRDINLAALCIAHRADFIRAFLLSKFGGLWIDADCILMRPPAPIFELLSIYDFIGYRERQGYVSNNFMGAQTNSKIAGKYYQRVCTILRSEQPIEWLTLGSHALTATIQESGVAWYEMSVESIQPVCWSHPEAFFTKSDIEGHERVFNKESYAYMLSANMVRGFLEKNPGRDLLENESFFSYLLNKSTQQQRNRALMNIAHRKNTDDDRWVIPEVVTQDMYRIKEVLSKITPSSPGYVIDCGAHIGAFSLMCSLHLKNVEVIAFEPNPDSFIYLSENAARFGNIKALNKAVDIKDGVLNLYSPDQIEWSGRWTAIPNANGYVPVEAISLFPFIKNLDKPVVILKLDLEGYEELIINSSTKEDMESIRTIVVETHTNDFDHDKLKDFGFRLLFQPSISSDRQYVYSRS